MGPRGWASALGFRPLFPLTGCPSSFRYPDFLQACSAFPTSYPHPASGTSPFPAYIPFFHGLGLRFLTFGKEALLISDIILTETVRRLGPWTSQTCLVTWDGGRPGSLPTPSECQFVGRLPLQRHPHRQLTQPQGTFMKRDEYLAPTLLYPTHQSTLKYCGHACPVEWPQGRTALWAGFLVSTDQSRVTDLSEKQAQACAVSCLCFVPCVALDIPIEGKPYRKDLQGHLALSVLPGASSGPRNSDLLSSVQTADDLTGGRRTLPFMKWFGSSREIHFPAPPGEACT